MSKAAISLIQTGLRDLGHDPGPVDGIYGAKTEAAAEAWLAVKGRAAGEVLRPATRSVILQGREQYPVQEVCIHCSATRPEWMGEASVYDQVAEITLWHVRDRGWRTIGYHWVVGRNGQLVTGRRETEIGAGVEGHNRGVIHVCLIGGFGSAARDRFADHFTPAQDRSLRDLLQGIGMRTAIRTISGHNDYAAKACPGFTVSTWLKGD
jgi:peptidoglycan hydrolase-like protein with peptidoglycan-binding domain